MAFGEHFVATRKSSFPFGIARSALFETFPGAFVILFASLFEPAARFLALVFVVIGILVDVAAKCARVAAFQANVAR